MELEARVAVQALALGYPNGYTNLESIWLTSLVHRPPDY